MNMISSVTSTITTDTKPKLTINDYAILQNVWRLDSCYSKKVSRNQLFITTLESFLSNVEPEQYPRTYKDHLIADGKVYWITYLFTSGAYLDDLLSDAPEKPVAFILRENLICDFRCCLVRLWDRKWTREFLLKQGAVEV